MSENLKNEIRGGKKSAMKLFSNVPTVTQATFNLQPVNKTGEASDSERMLQRRKRVCKKRKALYFCSWSIQNFINLAMYPCHADKRIQGWCARHCWKKKPHDFLSSLHRPLLLVWEAFSEQSTHKLSQNSVPYFLPFTGSNCCRSVSTFFFCASWSKSLQTSRTDSIVQAT